MFEERQELKRPGELPKSTRSTDMCQEAQTRPSEGDIVRELFTYHSPNQLQAIAYETVRNAAKHLAEVILANVPHGADRTTAIRKLREAVMTANVGIALNGLSL